MAYVLSLPPQRPFKRSFSDSPYGRSCSIASFASSTSIPQKHRDFSNFSSVSLETCPSVRAASTVGKKENLVLGASPPTSALSTASTRSCATSRYMSNFADPALCHRPNLNADCDQNLNAHVSGTSNGETEISENGNPAKVGDGPHEQSRDAVSLGANDYSSTAISPPSVNKHDGFEVSQGSAAISPFSESLPFKRWVSTLRRRNIQRKHHEPTRPNYSSLDGRVQDCKMPQPLKTGSRHRKSDSWSSSLGIINAVKTASVTLASQSIGPVRSRTSRMRGSGSEAIDASSKALSPIIDEATWLRSLQRRKILEELVTTEESYLADMKAFANVYLTLLTSMPSMSSSIRTSVEQTVTQIVELHNELLGELYQVIPDVEVKQQNISQAASFVRRKKHFRWHSADVTLPRHDAVSTVRKLRHSFEVGRTKEQNLPNITADTATVMHVAKVFNRYTRRFLVYEAWAAQSESMHRDVLSTYRFVPALPSFERGLESLAVLEGSINGRETNSGKGLTLPDLLIKPIQRICKYPLIFESLCRQTPSCDDPVAHEEVQRVLIRVREMADEINKATDNPKTRRLVETTWTLQDRMCFRDVECGGLSPSVIFHVLGHVIICGVLHACFETSNSIKDHYVVCVLYRSCLLLATMGRVSQMYNVLAVVPLANATVDEPDNSRGLQCHNNPHTWKLTFVTRHRLFEIMLTACHEKEEDGWKTRIKERITAESQDLAEGRSTVLDLFSSIPHDLKPLGSALGRPHSLARRISIQRAQTLGPKSYMRQVIIKNTQAVRISGGRELYQLGNHPVTRSQSHLSSLGHIVTLTPRRSDRIRLENALSDVWTKDVIPYPGLGSRRADSSFRASANSVMRKLSMASIASNFSKRSMSYASVSTSSTAAGSSEEAYGLGLPARGTRSTGDFGFVPKESRARTLQEKRRPTASTIFTSQPQPIVDFHTTPGAFLPEDFELKQVYGRTKREAAGASMRELKRRLGEYSRELRPMTPVLSTGRSSRTEEHGSTIQQSLSMSSEISEGGKEEQAQKTDARDDKAKENVMTRHEINRRLLVKSPSKHDGHPCQVQADQTLSIAELASVPRRAPKAGQQEYINGSKEVPHAAFDKPSKTRNRILKFWK